MQTYNSFNELVAGTTALSTDMSTFNDNPSFTDEDVNYIVSKFEKSGSMYRYFRRLFLNWNTVNGYQFSSGSVAHHMLKSVSNFADKIIHTISPGCFTSTIQTFGHRRCRDDRKWYAASTECCFPKFLRRSSQAAACPTGIPSPMPVN